MPSIFELRSNYNEVLQMLYDDEFIANFGGYEVIIDTLDSIEDAFEDKADGYAMIIKTIEADVEAIKVEEARLHARRKRLEDRKDWMKKNLSESMKDMGKTKFKTARFSFGIQKNGGKRPLVLDVDPSELPDEFIRVEYTAKNDLLRESLGDAESNQWCHLEEQGESLRIR